MESKYYYRVFFNTNGKKYCIDIIVYSDDMKSTLNVFYNSTYNSTFGLILMK